MANEIARSLRKRMTPQEVKLWVHLRRLKPQGLHFRRPVPKAGYIVDFACLSARLIVEIDGFQHGLDADRVKDETRDQSLRRLGFLVLRFWNHEVDRDLDSVVATIFHHARERLPS